MTADRLLAAIADLERELFSLGIDLSVSGAPGATDAELDRVAEETGIVLPEEARAWFQWHNGPANPRDSFTYPLRTAVGPGWNLTSIDQAVASYKEIREVVEETLVPADLDDLVPAHLFPVIKGSARGEVVIHTDGIATGAIAVLEFGGWEPGSEPGLPSLSALIELIVAALRAQVIRLDPAGVFVVPPGAERPPEFQSFHF